MRIHRLTRHGHPWARNFIDTTPPDILSLPRHFRDNGYLTLGLGKLWHQVRPALQIPPLLARPACL